MTAIRRRGDDRRRLQRAARRGWRLVDAPAHTPEPAQRVPRLARVVALLAGAASDARSLRRSLAAALIVWLATTTAAVLARRWRVERAGRRRRAARSRTRVA